MKRLPILICLCLLLLTMPCYAQDACRDDSVGQLAMLQGIVGGGSAAVACDPAAEGMGCRNCSGSAGGLVPNYIYCTLGTATCSGTLGDAGLYSSTTSTATATICVYSTNGSDADPGSSSNVKLSCSSPVNGLAASSEGVKTIDMGPDYSVTKNYKYWVCVSGGAENFANTYSNLGVQAFHACSGCNTTMPDNLDLTTAWTSDNTRQWRFYVTIK